MAGLSEQKIAIVRTLVETAPDKVVGSLQQALSETPDGTALGGVRRLVETEVFERTLRNMVLQPIVPMCVAEGDPRILTFPPRVLALLWRALRANSAEQVEQLRSVAEDKSPDAFVKTQDALVIAAAEGLRAAAAPEYATVAEVCDAACAGNAARLADCLQIAPIVRRAAERLPDWIAHPGGDTAAAARLAYKDCVELVEDAGPLFFHMLAPHMPHPWMVLRIISAVMDRPTERYLRDSELSSFGEAVFDDIDRTLNEIARLNPDDGVAAGRALAKRADLVVQQVVEIETSMDIQRDQGWGLRVVKQRASLANVIEGRLRDGEKATIEALPMVTTRHGRGRRALPRLTSVPEPRAVSRATTLLSFSDELRTTANYGGFAWARTKMVEKLSEYIDTYVEDALDMVRHGEVEDLNIAFEYLCQAATFKRLLAGDRAGELIRRRALAAIRPEEAAALAAAEAQTAPLARF